MFQFDSIWCFISIRCFHSFQWYDSMFCFDSIFRFNSIYDSVFWFDLGFDSIFFWIKKNDSQKKYIRIDISIFSPGLLGTRWAITPIDSVALHFKTIWIINTALLFSQFHTLIRKTEPLYDNKLSNDYKNYADCRHPGRYIPIYDVWVFRHGSIIFEYKL